MENSKKYHFVSTNEMYEQLSILKNEKKWSRSKTVVYILNFMMPLMNHYVYFRGESSDYGYIEINAEYDIKFSINQDLYRKLKHIHGSMHAFSIAVIVRRMINLFFKYKKLIGLKKLENILSNGRKCILKLLNTKKVLKKKYYMVHKYRDEYVDAHINMIYSKNFTLLGIRLIN